jgi:putative tryptophan/tyrosine transport system substrate-binding protein
MVTIIGMLAASGTPHIEAIRLGLRDHGLIENVDVKLVSRVANGDLGCLPDLVSDVLSVEPEIVIAVGAVSAQALRRARPRLPMVYVVVIDPAADGLARRSGKPLDHHTTGITTFDSDQAGVHARLLDRILPKLRRIAILADNSVSTCLADANKRAFRSRGVETRTIGIAGPIPDLPEAFARIAQFQAEALVVLEHPTTGIWRSSIARLALRQGLPTLFARDHANQEGLLAYGTSLLAAARRAPRLLKAMLDGKPGADNLIEHFRRPELLVNRTAAAAIDLTLPEKLYA